MDEQGKRVSWVELYLDLVFVLAVGELAHLIVAEPETKSVWIALGLFLIILLGEVVVEAGQASVSGHDLGAAGWAALVAGMLLAGALWWLYFDSAAELNLKVLELSGGSPTMARAIFAVGHMLPAFALLITAAGVGVSGVVRALIVVATFQLGRLHGDLSPYAYLWLLTAWTCVCATLTSRVDVARFLGARGESSG